MYNQYDIKKKCHEELILLVAYGTNPNKIEELLQSGWDPNVTDDNLMYPALKAAERNDFKILSLLITAGAKVGESDITGYTPLKYAELHDNKQMIRLIKKTLKSCPKSLKENKNFQKIEKNCKYSR